MVSKVNTIFNYKYIVDGETIWYRIKTLQGFLNGRKQAFEMQKVSEKNFEALKAKYEYLKSKPETPLYELLEIEAKIMENEIMQPDYLDCLEKNKEEIKNLEKLLEEAYAIAEPQRIEGYSDEQMLEATAPAEFMAKLKQEMASQILITGTISSQLIQRAMKYPGAIKELQEIGLLNYDDKSEKLLLTMKRDFDE